MFRSTSQRAALVMAAAAVVVFAASSSASAASQCAQPDYTGPTACPITTSGAYGGTLASDSEKDYFVFYAVKATAVSLTLNNAMPPTCVLCGGVVARLVNASGYQIAYTFPTASVSQGIPVPGLLSITLRRAGTYYLIVSGELTSDSSGNKVPLPYTFSITGTPNVQWPPPCIVPALARNSTLARAMRSIKAGDCTVGKVTRARSTRVKRGDVIALRPAPGAALPFAAPVAIVVSSGPGSKHEKRPKHKR